MTPVKCSLLWWSAVTLVVTGDTVECNFRDICNGYVPATQQNVKLFCQKHLTYINCLSLESASQCTSPVYRSWRLVTLTWSHTCQFVISFITTVTIHYSSLPLQAQNSSFPQIFTSIVLLPFHPLDWLHRLQLFFIFPGHVGFNFGTVC